MKPNHLSLHATQCGSVTTAGGIDRNTYDIIGPTAEASRGPLKTDAGARNLVYISSANTAYAITSVQLNPQTVGTGIAMSGWKSSYVSGLINAVGIFGNVCRGPGDCYTATLNRATFSSIGGDSGAPILSRTLPKAFGITYGIQAGDPMLRALYSRIEDVTDDLQVRLCLNAACT